MKALLWFVSCIILELICSWFPTDFIVIRCVISSPADHKCRDARIHNDSGSLIRNKKNLCGCDQFCVGTGNWIQTEPKQKLVHTEDSMPNKEV